MAKKMRVGEAPGGMAYPTPAEAMPAPGGFLASPPPPAAGQIPLPLLLQVINHDVLQTACRQLVQAAMAPEAGAAGKPTMKRSHGAAFPGTGGGGGEVFGERGGGGQVKPAGEGEGGGGEGSSVPAPLLPAGQWVAGKQKVILTEFNKVLSLLVGSIRETADAKGLGAAGLRASPAAAPGGSPMQPVGTFVAPTLGGMPLGPRGGFAGPPLVSFVQQQQQQAAGGGYPGYLPVVLEGGVASEAVAADPMAALANLAAAPGEA